MDAVGSNLDWRSADFLACAHSRGRAPWDTSMVAYLEKVQLMKQTVMTFALALAGMLAAGCAVMAQQEAPVEIELMTYPEIYAAIHKQGKTTVLVVNGGIEQRGPHAVLGGHSLSAKPAGVAIA